MEQIVRNFDDSMILIGKHLVDAGGVRRAGSGGVLLFPRVLPVPSSGGCTDLICSQFMLLRDHIGAQARLAHLLQANIPKKGNQVEDK